MTADPIERFDLDAIRRTEGNARYGIIGNLCDAIEQYRGRVVALEKALRAVVAEVELEAERELGEPT